MGLDILRRGLDDYIGLWEILRADGRLAHPVDSDRVERVLGAIGELIDKGYAVPGAPIRFDGFEPWPLGPSEAIARIRRDWDTLGREPNVGEVVWLANTEAGNRLVRETLQMSDE